MKYTTKKNRKNAKNRKTRKDIIILKGGAWYSYFLPLFGYTSDKYKKIDDKDENSNINVNKTEPKKEDTIQNAEKIDKTGNIAEKIDKSGNIAEKNDKKNNKKNNTVKTAKELYNKESDDATIEKEFYPNKDITTWCFNEPNYEPVGIVHVTSVVGINILRSYATTVRNIVGVKGTIDENMHKLRNEIYTEMENVMEKKNIDKICSVGVSFTKDSGSLILSAFGTALRKKSE